MPSPQSPQKREAGAGAASTSGLRVAARRVLLARRQAATAPPPARSGVDDCRRDVPAAATCSSAVAGRCVVAAFDRPAGARASRRHATAVPVATGLSRMRRIVVIDHVGLPSGDGMASAASAAAMLRSEFPASARSKMRRTTGAVSRIEREPALAALLLRRIGRRRSRTALSCRRAAVRCRRARACRDRSVPRCALFPTRRRSSSPSAGRCRSPSARSPRSRSRSAPTPTSMRSIRIAVSICERLKPDRARRRAARRRGSAGRAAGRVRAGGGRRRTTSRG